MKTKLLLLIILSSLSSISFGQICGTPSNSNESQLQKSSSLKSNSQYLESSTSICVNIKYHIVRETNGSGGFNSSNINTITSRLNEAFNEHKIYFNSLGHDFIDNSMYYDIDDIGNNTTEFDALVQINNNPNAINIYLINDAASYAGRANGILSQALVIENAHATSQVISHEVGHCFNLYHTHRGTWQCESNSSTCAEIDGVNNTTCGDEVADTPADPGLLVFDPTCSFPLNYLVDNNCNYTGGNGFNPDTDNIMSYAPVNCLEHFTSGQNTRIRQAFASYSVLQNVIGNSCPSLDGPDLVCKSPNSTFILQNAGTPVTWQVSSDLLIVSSSNTSITVKPKYSSGSVGQITANLSLGASITKEIQVNNPTLTNSDVFVRDSYYNNLTGSGTSFDPYLICDGEEYIINMYSNNVNSINYTTIPSSWTSYSYGIYEIAFTPNNMNYGNTYTIDIDYTGICSNSVHTIYFKKDNYCFGGYFTVSPNPSSENLNIEYKNSNEANTTFSENGLKSNYKLYDFQSNLVLKGKLDKQINNINVSALRKGMYILKIYTDENVETHQIIIN